MYYVFCCVSCFDFYLPQQEQEERVTWPVQLCSHRMSQFTKARYKTAEYQHTGLKRHCSSVDHCTGSQTLYKTDSFYAHTVRINQAITRVWRSRCMFAIWSQCFALFRTQHHTVKALRVSTYWTNQGPTDSEQPLIVSYCTPLPCHYIYSFGRYFSSNGRTNEGISKPQSYPNWLVKERMTYTWCGLVPVPTNPQRWWLAPH